MGDQRSVGELIHLVSAVTFPYTVGQLGKMPAEMLAALKIESGEHIAAILLATFLGAVPSTVDLAGGPDLIFTDLPSSVATDVGCDDVVTSACFEVKSVRGGFRRFFNQRNSTIGESHVITVRAIEHIVREAQREVELAATALRAKTDSTQSRNIVILLHPFEHLAVEAIENFLISPFLNDPGGDLADIASIWIVVFPSHAVRWERFSKRWVNLGSFGSLDGESDENEPFDDVLVAAEGLFCAAFREGRQSAWSVFQDGDGRT